MPVRPILLLPNPLLRQTAPPADWAAPDTARVIQDLWDTLDSHVGVGLAAPQIGESLRAIVVDATRARRPAANHGRLALLNPRILLAEGRISFREGCLSVPDLVAHISRAERVAVAALAPDGSPLTIEAEGFEAVILQHEIDHLNGQLFIDRVRRARDLKPRSA
ncbi:MAG: Peptide deformylase [candidate division BRC1 bacterium ADurb.BinA364]|nr:MAG: Peptide deformylase [candidate division BRC1 bacterium ADurb.BinA364]